MLRRHTYDDELEIMKKEVEMAAGGLSDASAHARGGMGMQHDQLGRAHSGAEVALRQGMEGGGAGRFQGGGDVTVPLKSSRTISSRRPSPPATSAN